MKSLVRLLKHCERRLDADAWRDVVWYDSKRPRRVSAVSLFEQYAWALLVPGIARKAAQTWAERTEFWRIFTVYTCRRNSTASLLKRVGVRPHTRMGRKLVAVHALGRELCGLTSKQVAERFFGGIVRTAALGEQHVLALDALPFVGEPSARFIIRNLGGELIKDDRWLVAVMRYFRCGVEELERAGARLGWRLGRVDIVLWCYCEQEIGSSPPVPALPGCWLLTAG
jgi:hypothetical protein